MPLKWMNQGYPTPNLMDCVSPSNVDSESVGKRRGQGLGQSSGRGAELGWACVVVQKGFLGVVLMCMWLSCECGKGGRRGQGLS
ncbi:hypothetical protein PIB30_094550, partial [Stylosanthes scabra]|nr:hypothetical protein [Stylosanthes scabra]